MYSAKMNESFKGVTMIASLDRATCAPPETTDDSLMETHHRPPMSVVVVRETPLKSITHIEQPRPKPSPSLAFGPRAADPTTGGNCLSGSSAFRLHPRGKNVATPSPSQHGARGRKRRAQCLVPASSIMGVTKDLFLSPAAMPPPSKMGFLSQLGKPISSPPSQPTYPSKSSITSEGKGTSLAIPMDNCYPSRMEYALQSLSIRSPKIEDYSASPSMHMKITPSRPGSSFLLYSSSPIVGSPYTAGPLSAAEGGGSVGSARSTKSSPKLAPLTVLQSQSTGTTGGEPHNYNTPTRRPPLHGRPTTSMLMSIDGKRSVDSDYDDDDEDHVVPTTPKLPLTKVNLSPRFSNASSVFRSMSPPGSRSMRTPQQQLRTPQPRTPQFVLGMSPARESSHHRSPASTPLPRVKLTPRKTPTRTPGSQSSCHDDSLPCLPSPSDHREFGLLPNDLLANRSCSQRPSFILRENPSNEDAFVSPPHKRKSNHFCMPSSASNKDSPSLFRQIRKPSCLPVPNRGHAPANPPSFSASGFPPFPETRDRTPQHANINHFGARLSQLAGVKTTSLLSPSPSKSGSFFDRLMSSDEAAMGADGDLTDTDDDEPFILADPATLEKEREILSRSRQRPRRSYNSLDQQTAGSANRFPQSFKSLASSGYASNTSLLGMDFIRGDSTSSLLLRCDMATSQSSLAVGSYERFASDNKMHLSSSQGLSSIMTENSLTSIGLALEHEAKDVGNITCGRDLVTPPPMMETNSNCSPPTLPNDFNNNHNKKGTPAKLVCLSRSDPDAVNMTIARMILQETHPMHFPRGMECSS